VISSNQRLMVHHVLLVVMWGMFTSHRQLQVCWVCCMQWLGF